MSAFTDGAARERAVTEAQNFIVTAGAGTGKTSVLVERALYLVLSGRLNIGRLAAITFTEKAAAELKRRMAEAITEALELLQGLSPAETASEATRTLDRLRSAGRLVRLAATASPARLEQACARAHAFGVSDYPSVKRILAAGLEQLEQPEPRPLAAALASVLVAAPAPAPRPYTFMRQASEFVLSLLAGHAASGATESPADQRAAPPGGSR